MLGRAAQSLRAIQAESLSGLVSTNVLQVATAVLPQQKADLIKALLLTTATKVLTQVPSLTYRHDRWGSLPAEPLLLCSVHPICSRAILVGCAFQIDRADCGTPRRRS